MSLKLTSLLFILLLTGYTYSKPKSSAITYDIQMLLAEGYSTFGCFGFSGELNLNLNKAESIISPYVSYGAFTSTYLTDVREIRFTEGSAGINTFYKFINYKYLEIKAGTGVGLAYLKGFKDEWNEVDREVHLPREEINEISIAVNLIGGVKIGNKVSLEILPIYFSIGLSDKKYTPKVGIGYTF